jgi:hypothetical protein
LLLPSTTLASAPVQTSDSWTVDYVDTASCGFPVTVHGIYHEDGLWFYDDTEALVRQLFHGTRDITFTGPGGRSLLDNGTYTREIDYQAHTDTYTGTYWNINIPGTGVWIVQGGRVVTDILNGERIFESGRAAFAPTTAPFCDYLGG